MVEGEVEETLSIPGTQKAERDRGKDHRDDEPFKEKVSNDPPPPGLPLVPNVTI